MKKVLTLFLMIGGSLMIHSSALYAQVTTDAITTMAPAPPQLDAKKQKKVDKAKADLAQNKEQLAKEEEKLSREQAKFDKNNAKGKLSPRDIEKDQKSLAKAKKSIEKLKQEIGKDEKYLASVGVPIPR